MPLIVEAPKPMTRIISAIQRELRIVFFGTPLFAVPALRALNTEGWPIDLVVTAPDKPVGRKMLLTPSPVKSVALELGLPAASPFKLSDESFWAQYSQLRPDLCIVVAYGKIIPQRYLDEARLGFLNIHPSMLPLYRGPSPIASAILDGRTETGVTIMKLDDQMDHGPILAQERWTIPSGFDAPMAEDELSRIGARLLCSVLTAYVDGTQTLTPQDHSAATYCSKFEREHGRLDWTQPSDAVVNRIRALGTNPGTWTTAQGAVLNIVHAHRADAAPEAVSGTVQLVGRDVVVSCGTGAVALETVQPEGRSRMSARDLLNGRPGLVGSVLI
jgi:methionyl-tRNA formyltransferase